MTTRTAYCSCGQLSVTVSGEPVGATVHYAIEDFVAVPIGPFADPDFPPPAFSVYEERMHGWVSVPGDVDHTD